MYINHIGTFRLCNVRGLIIGETPLGLQLENPVHFVVYKTQLAFISEDDLFQRSYAQIYR